MKLIIISDTHGKHNQIEMPKEGDVLLCCGDITLRGELSIMEDFARWLKELPYKWKLITFGNHEVGMRNGYKRKPAIEMIRNAGAVYLEDEWIDIDGLCFHFSPYQPIFHAWEFQLPRGKMLAEKWAKIPDRVDVLATHGPPYGILDQAPRGFDTYENVGDEDLLRRIKQLKKLKIHAFGHIHDAYNVIERDGVIFANAAICDEQYRPTHKPIVIEINNEKEKASQEGK